MMRTANLRNVPFFCSWSGGKDSCLALHLAVAAGGVPQRLLCMTAEDGRRTNAHGLSVDVIEAQAAALGIALTLCATTWEDYEEKFVAALRKMAAEGIAAGVFGDIDIEAHKAWEEKVCRAAGLRASLPLWGRPRERVLAEFLALPAAATVVAARADVALAGLAGRQLTARLARELALAGCDVAGEHGEYHTAVTDCPLFASPVAVRVRRARRVGDHWFANVTVNHDGEETG